MEKQRPASPGRRDRTAALFQTSGALRPGSQRPVLLLDRLSSGVYICCLLMLIDINQIVFD